jgi:uncharacterized protein (TIGR03435 family)
MRLVAYCSVAFFATCQVSVADGQTFDAASVKLYSQAPQPWTITGGPGTSDPTRFRAPRIGMINLLAKAFEVSLDQIVGPAWLRDVTVGKYSIVATMPADATKEQFQKMLQNLLAERFHLVFHRETRNFPGYALVVDKGGPRFKEVASTEPANAAPNTGSTVLFNTGSDDFRNVPPGPRTVTISRGGNQRTMYQERTMAEFVSNLGFLIGSSQGKSVLDGYAQPRVVDQTGLTEKYTFILEYHSESGAALAKQFQTLGNPDNANGPLPITSDPDGGGPDILTAIKKQLGLRLDKTKDVPLEMMVVDSVDKVPTPD